MSRYIKFEFEFELAVGNFTNVMAYMHRRYVPTTHKTKQYEQ